MVGDQGNRSRGETGLLTRENNWGDVNPAGTNNVGGDSPPFHDGTHALLRGPGDRDVVRLFDLKAPQAHKTNLPA